MRVAIVVEQRFARTADGRVWTEASFAYPFWKQHLDIFSSVLVIARVRDVGCQYGAWARADGEGVSFLTVPYYVGAAQYAAKFWEVRRALRDAPISRDAVILRPPSQIAFCLQPILERQGHPYGVQVVSDPYDFLAPGSIRHVLRPFLRWWFPRKTRKQCHRACACAYVTERALQARYPAGPRAFTTHFSDVLLPDNAYACGRQFLKPPASPHIITVGSLQQPYKGVDVLLDAIAICRARGMHLHATVVGDGVYRAELEARSASLGLTGNVQFVGYVSEPELVRSYLDRADLFVLPSRVEGLPRAMLEAMARALPCIGSAVGGIPELLPASDLVPVNDAPKLAEKLQEILRAPARLAAMSNYSLAIARHYRSELLRHRHADFLRQLLSATKNWMDRSLN